MDHQTKSQTQWERLSKLTASLYDRIAGVQSCDERIFEIPNAMPLLEEANFQRHLFRCV